MGKIVYRIAATEVRADNPDTNYGGNPSITLFPDEGSAAAMKFDLADIRYQNGMTLWLYATKNEVGWGDEPTVILRRIKTTWDMDTLTWEKAMEKLDVYREIVFNFPKRFIKKEGWIPLEIPQREFRYILYPHEEVVSFIMLLKYGKLIFSNKTSLLYMENKTELDVTTTRFRLKTITPVWIDMYFLPLASVPGYPKKVSENPSKHFLSPTENGKYRVDARRAGLRYGFYYGFFKPSGVEYINIKGKEKMSIKINLKRLGIF